MLAAFGAGRVPAVEHGVPSFFEANVAQHLRLERFQRGRLSAQFRFHANDLLLEFAHFRVGEEAGGREATTGAPCRAQRAVERRRIRRLALLSMFRGGFSVGFLVVVVVVIAVVAMATPSSFGRGGRGGRVGTIVETQLISVGIQFD